LERDVHRLGAVHDRQHHRAGEVDVGLVLHAVDDQRLALVDLAIEARPHDAHRHHQQEEHAYDEQDHGVNLTPRLGTWELIVRHERALLKAHPGTPANDVASRAGYAAPSARSGSHEPTSTEWLPGGACPLARTSGRTRTCT